VAANGANVIVTIAIARLLSSRGYGSLGQLIVLFLTLSMPGSALLVAVVRRVTAWSIAGQAYRIKPWATSIRRWGLAGLGLLALVAWASRSWVAGELSLPGPAGVAEVLIAGGAWALLSAERGLIQSRHDYNGLAWNVSVEAAARTTLTITLIVAGLAVEGAALALTAAMAAAILHAQWLERRPEPTPEANSPDPTTAPARTVPPVISPALEPKGDPLPVDRPSTPAPDGTGRRHLAVDLVTALVALFLLATLQGLDVEIVGRHSPQSIGSYNAISVASKAVVFLAIVLSGYLLPEAVLRCRQGGHAIGQLGVALLLVEAPAAILVLAAAGAPRETLRILFGPDKAGAAPAFVSLALAMGCLAATALCTYYLLGIGHRGVLPVLGAAALVTVALVNAAHGDAVVTARTELACQGTLALVTGTLVLLSVVRTRSYRLASS
jgi:O-antigen/teichoic acid export membrane protein